MSVFVVTAWKSTISVKKPGSTCCLWASSFRHLTKVNVTSVFQLPSQWSIFFTFEMEKLPISWKVCCVEYWCEKVRKHMGIGESNREHLLKWCKTLINKLIYVSVYFKQIAQCLSAYFQNFERRHARSNSRAC